MKILKSKMDFIIGENGISSVEQVHIGGVNQSILIQAENSNNPILLIIHGGPSMPLPGVSSRGKDYTIVTNTKELVKHFVLVFWDQRGTGKSYHPTIPQETMTVEQFVSDAKELTDYLTERFQQEKIFLAAHSWGSVIGMNLVARYPGKFYSYIGLSQIISWTENDRLSLKWMKEEAKRRKKHKALKELESVGEPPFVESFKQWGVLRKWQRIFNTLVYTDPSTKHPGLIGVSKDMVFSEDYSIKDIVHSFYHGFKLVYSQTFIEELADFNFMESVQELQIPITFIHGSKDFHVHGSLVEEFYNRVDATHGKKLVWVEKSAHIFHPEDTQLIEQYLLEQLRYLP
ncbi:alpha/beta fold hydrolase [Sutcliffiella halmapala]